LSIQNFVFFLFQLAPQLSLQEEFVFHWKAVTTFFIEHKGKFTCHKQLLPCSQSVKLTKNKSFLLLKSQILVKIAYDFGLKTY